jgi:hypothetical protein
MTTADRIANHILRYVWYELAGVYAPGSVVTAFAVSYTPTLDEPRIQIRTGDGHTVELTARLLPPDSPAAVRQAESIAAIERGEVE